MKRAVLASILVAAGVLAGVAGTLLTSTFPRSKGEPAEGVKQLWTCSMHPQVIQNKPGNCPICGMKLVPIRKEPSAAQPQKERKVRYYWDPMMRPPYISDKPGKSPMGMDLIAVYEDEVRAGPTVTIDPVLTQNIGVRVARVEEGPLVLSVRTVGYLREAETSQHDITLKVDGWIERLYANTEGMFDKKGDPLFDLYSPEVSVAQEELLLAHRALERFPAGAEERLRADAVRLVESSRQKLALWNVPVETIQEVLRTGKAGATVTFRSPADGFVIEKMVVQGSAVEARMKLLRIVDQSVLWSDAQIYESQIPYLKLGQKARATVRGRPEAAFEGEVIFLSPQVNPMTRTAVARVAFANRDLALKPGLYATVEFSIEVAPRALLVPREAVIDTGVRQVAFVALEGGHFEPRLVRMGIETGDGRAQVLSGLAPGERVVTSGQFLIDSESRMREAIQKMTGERLLQPPGSPKPDGKPAAAPHVHSKATVDSVIAPYLEMTRVLADDRAISPAAVDGLVEAARKIAGEAGHARGAVEEVARAAAQLRDKPIKEQREAFKTLSEAVVDLTGHMPPSGSGGGTLLVFRCDMAKARWLQTTPEPANPDYGKAMGGCGEITATVKTGQP